MTWVRSECSNPDCGGKFGPVVTLAPESHEFCTEHTPRPSDDRALRLLAHPLTSWLVIYRPHGAPKPWWSFLDPRIVIDPSTYARLISKRNR